MSSMKRTSDGLIVRSADEQRRLIFHNRKEEQPESAPEKEPDILFKEKGENAPPGIINARPTYEPFLGGNEAVAISKLQGHSVNKHLCRESRLEPYLSTRPRLSVRRDGTLFKSIKDEELKQLLISRWKAGDDLVEALRDRQGFEVLFDSNAKWDQRLRMYNVARYTLKTVATECLTQCDIKIEEHESNPRLAIVRVPADRRRELLPFLTGEDCTVYQQNRKVGIGLVIYSSVTQGFVTVSNKNASVWPRNIYKDLCAIRFDPRNLPHALTVTGAMEGPCVMRLTPSRMRGSPEDLIITEEGRKQLECRMALFSKNLYSDQIKGILWMLQCVPEEVRMHVIDGMRGTGKTEMAFVALLLFMLYPKEGWRPTIAYVTQTNEAARNMITRLLCYKSASKKKKLTPIWLTSDSADSLAEGLRNYAVPVADYKDKMQCNILIGTAVSIGRLALGTEPWRSPIDAIIGDSLMGEPLDRTMLSLFSRGQPATTTFLVDSTMPSPLIFQHGRERSFAPRFGLREALQNAGPGLLPWDEVEDLSINLRTLHDTAPQLMERIKDLYKKPVTARTETVGRNLHDELFLRIGDINEMLDTRLHNPVLFAETKTLNTTMQHTQTHDQGHSYCNDIEAEVVARLATLFLDRSSDRPSDRTTTPIMVTATYRGQLPKIRSFINQDLDVDHGIRVVGLDEITQRRADVVIISMMRMACFAAARCLVVLVGEWKPNESVWSQELKSADKFNAKILENYTQFKDPYANI